MRDARCVPRHKAWGHPMSHLDGPRWPLTTVPCHCSPATFCPSLGATHGTGPGPSCHHHVPSHGQCHQLVAPQGHPSTHGTPQAEGHQPHPPHTDPQSDKFVGFAEAAAPGTAWLFIYIPKATLITPQGGFTPGNFLLGQKVGGKNPFEQSKNPDVREGTPVPAPNHRPCSQCSVQKKLRN